MYKIYGLKLKDSEDIKYIGYTSRLLEKRFHDHIFNTIRLKTKNANWIKKHKDEIEIILIEDNIPTHKDVCSMEIYYIKMYKELGYDLNNLTNGGDGVCGKPHTEETKSKISKANKGKIISEEQKRKLSNKQTGKKYSNEAKMKMSESHRGKLKSEETKNKMRKPKSEESKRKMSEARKGKVLSEETKKKIGNSSRGKSKKKLVSLDTN